MLLTNAESIPDATEQFHVENCSTLGTYTGENLPADDDPTTDENIYGTVFAVGGTAVVSDGVLAGAGAATKCGDAIEVTSATISYDNVQDQACLVYDGVGAGWGDPETHNGPVLIPVPGSAADGLDPQITAVEIYGSDDPEATGGTVGAEFSGSILRVELGQDEHGMTQAEFAEIWASIPPAAATFAVVLGSSDPFGPPNAGSSDVSVYCTETAADYVIEITFNQPVGRYNNFETTPNEMLGSLRLWETTDGAREGLPTPDSASPLFNVADPSGNAVFTYTWEALPYSYLFECGLPFDIEEGEEEYICLPEVGDDFSIFSDEPSPEVETSFGVHNRDFTVEFTAG